MVHVTEYADCGELMWATRLADSEGEYECWELLSPKAVHRVSVSDKCMATIAPSGQLVLAMLGMEQQSVTLRSCRALEGITGDEGRQLWEFHLGLALNESHGQMIQALWRFYAMLPPGGLRRFSLGILRDRRFITGFYRGRAIHHHHHDHVGGLLEHSVEVAMTARMLCRQYRLDGRTADVAFLGGLLHDVGKLYLYYNVEAGEGICSQHEALNFMKLEPHLQSLMSQDPRAFEALSACLSASIGKPLIQYMPETIVKMADRLSAEVFNWRRVFAGLPDFYWFRKSTSDTRIYKRLD